MRSNGQRKENDLMQIRERRKKKYDCFVILAWTSASDERPEHFKLIAKRFIDQD